MRRINIAITQPEFDALHRLAAQSGIGFGELIRRAIDQYIASPDVAALIALTAAKGDVRPSNTEHP
jgi:Ribbon-helix-helix protein, copG family